MAKSKKAPKKPSKAAGKKVAPKKPLPQKIKPTAKSKPAKSVAAAKPKKAAKGLKATKPNKATKSIKTTKPIKVSKVQAEEVVLHQAFIDSLANLENHWIKKTATLEKELESLINKQQKALLSKTPKQIEKAHLLETEIVSKREAFVFAALEANKIAALSNNITEFESEWSQQLNNLEASLVDTEDDEENSIQVEDHQPTYKVKSKAPKQEILEEEWEEVEELEEESDDLEDIFMPQDDLSEFEVIEDFSVTSEEDPYEDDES